MGLAWQRSLEDVYDRLCDSHYLIVSPHELHLLHLIASHVVDPLSGDLSGDICLQ